VALSADGKRAVSASFDLTVRLWDVESGKELHVFRGHTQSIWVVAISPDGRLALSGGDDRVLRLWGLPKEK
jgi:WD40 repeat protein